MLVNNAGYSQSGALETVAPDDLRRQFETNVFGLVRMCQLALPGMREQRWGRIINISSMGANLVFPGGGVYHATKYAVNALSDALRFEVKGFGVDVVTIEPGLIVTEFGNTAAAQTAVGDGPYATFNAQRRLRDEEHLRGGPGAAPRRRPGHRGEGDREGDQAAAHPHARDPVRPLPDRPAQADDRRHVGPLRRHAVPASGLTGAPGRSAPLRSRP